MQKLKKTISTFMVAVLLLLTFPEVYSGDVQVRAASGNSNVISYRDVHVDGFREIAEWYEGLGDIDDVTLDMPGFTLTNIRIDLTARQLLYDLILDQPIVMTSGSGTHWDTNSQRTRNVEISTYFRSDIGHLYAGTVFAESVEGPGLYGVQFNNVKVFSQSDLKMREGMTAIGAEIDTYKEVVIEISAMDSNHMAGELGIGNGWRNTVRKSVQAQLILSAPPALTIATPNDQQLSEHSVFIPVVHASDPDGDRLEVNYYIDSEAQPRETKVVTNTATAQTVSFSPVNMGSLPEGAHTLRFTVSDGKDTAQGSIRIIVDKSNPSLGPVNATSSDSQIQLSGSATDSISGLDSAPYRYTVGGLTSGWTAEPSFTASGLASNTAYNTKFEAKDRTGHIALKEQQVYTKAQAPAISIQQNGETSLKLLLNDRNSLQTQYLIQSGSSYVSSSGRLTASPVWFTPASKTISLGGLTPDTLYTFQAKSKNIEGVETAFGAPASGTTIAEAPRGITAETSQQWVKLTWPASANALSFDVEADGRVINNGAANIFTHNGLLANSQHTYRVRVHNAGGISSWSQPLTKLTLPDPPPAPRQLLATPTQKYITLTWDLVPKATGYEVEADGLIVDNGNSNTFVHQGLKPSTNHTYRVRASNSGGKGEWSTPAQQQTWPDPPETPTKLSGVQDIHTVTVKWDEMARASGYEIEVDGLILDNKNATSYTHAGLEALSGHTYRVRATNIGGKSAWSVPLDITTHPEIPDVPTNIMTTSDEKQITSSWYVVPHTDSYDVEIDNSTVVNVTYNSFVHDKLLADTKHSYRIRAKNISGDSAWSKPVTMTTMPEGTNAELLTNIVAVVTNKSITLSWDTVAPDARYDIEVDGRLLDNASDTIYNHTGLKAEEFHTYKIRVKQGNETGEWVAVLALSTLPDLPGAPSQIEAFAQNTSIELHWQRIEGASGYQLEIDGKSINVGNATSYNHNNLASGTAHIYRVRAQNVTGVTAWSPSLQKSTTSPNYILQVQQGKVSSLTVLAQNVQDFSELGFVVTYDPDELELMDLYDFTPVNDLANGKIADSNLSVTHTAGKITFTIDQNIIPGTSWSGEITTLLFKSKKTGEASVQVVVD